MARPRRSLQASALHGAQAAFWGPWQRLLGGAKNRWTSTPFLPPPSQGSASPSTIFSQLSLVSMARQRGSWQRPATRTQPFLWTIICTCNWSTWWHPISPPLRNLKPSVTLNALPLNTASRLCTTIVIMVTLPTALLSAHVRNQDNDLPSVESMPISKMKLQIEPSETCRRVPRSSSSTPDSAGLNQWALPCGLMPYNMLLTWTTFCQPSRKDN